MTHPIRWGRRALPVLPLILAGCLATLLVSLSACSDSTEPNKTEDQTGGAHFEGTIDPGTQSFVLQSVEVTTDDGPPVRIELVGSGLQVDPSAERVTLEVALHNADTRAVYAPVSCFIGALSPPSVTPQDYDQLECPDDRDAAACAYGWDYSALIGDDSILGPGETSGTKTWAFHAPGLGSFSFSAHVRVGLAPDLPRIAGLCFFDPNENGHPDPGEGPAGGVSLIVRAPNGDSTAVFAGDTGRWSVPVTHSGLYRVLAIAPPTFQAVHFTTPNPLEVLLLPRADGTPQSFLHANFGIANGPDPGQLPPVMFTEHPDSLAHDFYHLLQFMPDGKLLRLQVGISGCSPDHPLALYMVGGFIGDAAGNGPLRAKLVLAHDDRSEMCDAFFQRDLGFDLRPILRRYAERFGQPGPVLCVFVDFAGQEHPFLLMP